MTQKTKTIVMCSSAAFYEHVGQISDELEKLGWPVVIPKTATKMRKTGNYDVKTSKTWYRNAEDFHIKADLMHAHFDEVEKGDIILVVNDEKHGIPGYIGPNVLMEMGLAFHFGKPIYVLNPIDEEMPFYEEVLGMGSVILEGDLNKVKES